MTKILEVVLGLKDKLSGPVKRSASIAQKAAAPFRNLGKLVAGLIAAYAGYRAVTGFINFMKDAVRLAQEQEAAEIGLIAALRAKNQYTIEGFNVLREYAKEMQNAIGVGDEMTLQTMATIEAITGLSQQALPDAMKAVVQISELYGVQFKDAGILLAKTLSSNINAFSRYGIQVDTAASKTEKLAEILEKTSAGWDMAIERANTMEGATRILNAAWGDLKEEIGKVITQNPALIEILKLTTNKITEVTDSVVENRSAWIRWTGDVMFSTARAGLALGKFVAGLGVAWQAVKMGAYQIWSWLNAGETAFLKAVQDSVNLVIDAINILIARGVRSINKFIAAANTIFNANIGFMKAVKIGHVDLNYTIANFELSANKSAAATADAALTMRNYADTIVAMTEVQGELTDIQNELNSRTQELTGSSTAAAGASKALADTLDKTGGSAKDAADKVKELTDNIGALTIASAKLPPMSPITGAVAGAAGAATKWKTYTYGFEGKGEAWVKSFLGFEDMDDEGEKSGKRFGKSFWEAVAAAGIGAAAGGGGAKGILASILPIAGSAFGPIGTAIGGVLGNLFGGKASNRGANANNPVYTKDVGINELKNILLNIAKSGIVRQGAPALVATDGGTLRDSARRLQL